MNVPEVRRNQDVPNSEHSKIHYACSLDSLFLCVVLLAILAGSLSLRWAWGYGQKISSFGIIFLIFLVALFLAERKMRARKRARFNGRQDLNEQDFYARFYGDVGVSKETVFEVLRVVGNASEMPPTRIRPSDRFDKELAPMPGWKFDDGIVEVDWFVREKQKRAGVREDVKLDTVDDLIRYVGQLEARARRGFGA